MAKERNAFRAGLFIVISIALILSVTVAIKGVGQFTESRQTRVVTFRLTDDLGGLRAGDDVRVGGFKVGVVKSIDPVGLDTGDPKLQVTLTIPARFKLHEGARFGVQTGLTGSSNVNIDYLGAGKEIGDNEQIAGRPDPKSLMLASLAETTPDLAAIARSIRQETLPKVNGAVDSFHQTGQSATELVRNINSKVDPIVGKYDTVTVKAGAMMDSVTEMIGPAAPDFKGTMANLNVATAELRQKVPGMLEKVAGALDGAQKALLNIQSTVANTTEITSNLKQIVGKNQGRLDGMIASLKSTGDNLKAASMEIRRSPWRLLYKPQPGEVSNLNLYDSTRQFAEGANDLNDAAQALRDALGTKSFNKEELQSLVNKLETTFAHFHDVERKLWADVRE